MHSRKSARVTTTSKHFNNPVTDRRSKKSEDKFVEKKLLVKPTGQFTPEDRNRRSTASSTVSGRSDIHSGASMQVTSSAGRLTHAKTSSTAVETTKSVAVKSGKVGSRLTLAFIDSKKPLAASTSRLITAADVRKTSFDKPGKPTTSANQKSLGKQRRVKSVFAGKSKSLSSGDARNFNANAVPVTTGSYSRIGVLSTAAGDANVNRNAGDTEATEPATAAGGEGAAAEDSRKASVIDDSRKKSVPADGRKVSEAGDTDDLHHDAASVSDDADSWLSEADERSAKTRRSKASQSEDGELAKVKAKSSKLRLCVRRCIAEDETWDLKTVPDLDMLVVKHLADNYAEEPVDLDTLPAIYKEAVLRILSPELPLEVVVERIDDENYWRRRCDLTWDLSKVSVSDHGGSWKRMYFERRLWRLVETFVPRLSEPEQLVEMVALGGRFVRRLEIGELMPPVIRAADKQSADADDGEQTSADVEEEIENETLIDLSEPTVPRDHLRLPMIVDCLPCLERLRITYGVRRCGLNFNWNIFHFTLKDCSWLTEFIAGSPLLRTLEIHRSRVDDTRLMLLANAFRDHPSLTEISLPYNVLGDDAARVLARHLDHTGPRVKLLDLTHNRVGPDGALSLAFSLTRNTTLRRLILRHNLIRDAGCEALAHALSSAGASLTELSVAANGLSDVAATALGAMLAANTTLCGLDVSANALGESGGDALVEGLRGNRSLVELDVRGTQCGDANTHSVRLKLTQNRHVRKPCDAAEDDDQLDEEEQDEDEEEEQEDDEDQQQQHDEARRTSVAV